MTLKTVILAAGKGTRMRSAKPKVLHQIGGMPLLEHVYQAATKIGTEQIIIIKGHGADLLETSLSHLPATWLLQEQQLGTGHAVSIAMPEIGDDDSVLVLYGDVPLINPETLSELCQKVTGQTLALLTVTLSNPTGYGRIIRNPADEVVSIVEEKDATAEERSITEVNTGILAVKSHHLNKWLSRLSNDNAQGEYYLTDIIAMAVNDGVSISTVEPKCIEEVLGINDRVQQAQLERVYQRSQAEQLLLQGVSLADPARFDLRGKITAIGQDVSIDINVLIEGEVTIGSGVTIGANCIIRNARIADGVEILPNSLVEDCQIGEGSRIGPYARLRPETVLADHVHVGNFVEIKKSNVASGSKINHLSYVGDADVGSGVNIGAGTITCNYDGANKFRTIIEDGAFIGSDTQLVAPVRVGKGATIGAGSTITKDTPEEKLTLSRSKQISVDNWQRPKKKQES